jgi:alanine racemase
VWAEIRLDAVRRNVARIRARVGEGVALLAVVKANAYGHGAVAVARAALEAGVSRLGVGNLEEGTLLREAGITAPIHVLGGLAPGELEGLVPYRLTPMVHSIESARAIARQARAFGVRVPVHVLLDTGMGRFGVRAEEAESVLAAVFREPGLRLAGLGTHMSRPLDPSFTGEQLARFQRVLRLLEASGQRPEWVHAAASAALFRYPGARFNLVRPGLSLFGADPGGLAEAGARLEPALSIRSRLLFVKDVPAGTPVSYGALYRTLTATRIGAVAIGYSDGYPLSATGNGEAIVRGVRVPIVGRVTMDYVLVDLGGAPTAEEGDVVTLVGRDGAARIPLEEVARAAGVIPYAVSTGLGTRVRRIYLDGRRAPAARRPDLGVRRPIAASAPARNEERAALPRERPAVS